MRAWASCFRGDFLGLSLILPRTLVGPQGLSGHKKALPYRRKVSESSFRVTLGSQQELAFPLCHHWY